MSYMVEDLILRSMEIRESKDIESDDYSNLLTVENCIKTLAKENRLSKQELKILNMFAYYRSNKIVSRLLNGYRRSVFKKFKLACDKIAFELGEHFTDEGLINALSIKYNLTEEEIQRLRAFIKSELRHLILRSRYKANEFI